MKIAYLVLLHHKFDQALRMIRRLAGPNVSFVIHIDKAADDQVVEQFKKNLSPLGSVIYAKRERARWASYHQALAWNNCIHSLVSSGVDFDRCVSVSGQDYPIASLWQITKVFRESPDVEFMEAFPLNLDDNEPGRWSWYFRYRRYHFWLGNRRISVPFLSKKPPGISMFHGSAFWALSKKAIIYLDGEIRKNWKLRRFLQTSFTVDEVYIHTLLMNSSFAKHVAGANMTFLEITATSGPHPRLLSSSDFGKLMSSGKLFARKFDATVDSKIMDMLDDIGRGRKR
jgi:Core-2/I-Branching enzyme